MVSVLCTNTGEKKEFNEGMSLLEILPSFGFGQPYPIIGALVNNVVQSLKYRVFNSRTVEFLDYRSYAGRSIYSSSLCFLFSKACEDCFPGCRVTLRRPISKGYFCHVSLPDGRAFGGEELKKVKAAMRSLAESNLPIRRHEVTQQEAIDLFRLRGYDDKVRLLETSDFVYVKYYSIGDSIDYYCSPLLPSTGYLKVWDLSPYRGGLLLRVPDRHQPEELAPFREQPKTFEIFAESQRWNRIMDLETVGDVNIACSHRGRATDLIQISEALQEKKIVQIAEEIDRRHRRSVNPLRLVLITGPTSSGKSTFCKKLSIQLKACGLHPISFSTDDYFVNRVDTPKLPDGSYDFDNFETVAHEALQEDVLRLLAGDTVQVPEYNFVTGIREYNGKTLDLDEGSVLLIEGIHALNPKLTDKVNDQCKYRIFINTITSISLDDHNSIPTSDNRLLRRIIRDHKNGSFTAAETIRNWPNVRRAEVKWIYPYQEDADVLFNSSYIVEFAVLRPYAEQVLATVRKNTPEYSEVHRLLSYLQYFNPVPDKDVPATSLLRGVIGGSNL